MYRRVKMEVDQKIKWAKKISEKLYSVRRNEFRTWIEFFQQNDLDSALEYALKLSRSKMLRSQQKQAFGQIFYVLNKSKNELESMSEETVTEIFGYIMWGLHIWAKKKVTFKKRHSKTDRKHKKTKRKR